MPMKALPKDAAYTWYRELRDRAAVQEVDWPGFCRLWLVVRHEEGTQLFKDKRFVKNRNHPLLQDGPSSRRYGPKRQFGLDLPESDPPDHTRLRKLISTAFTSRSVERLNQRIEQMAHERLDRVQASGRIELVADFATPIPIAVITELLNLPIHNLDRLRWLAVNLTFGVPNTYRDRLRLAIYKRQFAAQLRQLFEQRRREPGDDLISGLVQATADGSQLSPDELMAMVFVLLTAGYVSTAHLLGTSVRSLLRFPDQLAALRRDPTLMSTAVDELIRFETPLEFSSAYYASSDIELAGALVPRGTAVRVALAAANHDERVFSDPERLDLTRSPNPHLAFGQGLHYCVGAPLARAEIGIALRVLLERCPDLRLSDPASVRWNARPVIRGLDRLELEF